MPQNHSGVREFVPPDPKQKAVDFYSEQARIANLEGLAQALLDPEMYGRAISAEIRDHARRALGMVYQETGL